MGLKPIFDYTLASILLVVFAFPMLLMWLIASWDTGQNGFFIHTRIGKNAKPFKMFKIRTLKGHYTDPITTEKTHQLTKSGRFFTRYKLDELPQLLNILNGTMSFVGPRPDVAGYADELEGEDRIILSVKPGITGPTQLKYRNEREILNKQSDPKKFNDEVLWRDKVEINKAYVRNQNFMKDLKILWNTVF